MKKYVSYLVPICDGCGRNLFLSNRITSNYRIKTGKKRVREHDFCNDNCIKQFEKKRRKSTMAAK